jgi:opacity protein-like surface antigen
VVVMVVVAAAAAAAVAVAAVVVDVVLVGVVCDVFYDSISIDFWECKWGNRLH